LTGRKRSGIISLALHKENSEAWQYAKAYKVPEQLKSGKEQIQEYMIF
jgi:hypothetical protein